MNEHDLYRVMKDIDRKYTDELHQYAAELVTTKRRRETMKQNTKKRSAVTRLFPWNIGISAAVVACAVIAVSIGKEVIGQEKQMQIGMSGTSITDQLSVREPLPIEVRAADGIDIDMNLPESGKAEVMRSIDEAQAWIDLLKQSGEYGRETGEGFHPCLEILEMEKEYLDHDIIMCAVPYHFMQSDSGVAQHAFFGGTITESGKLTVETGMVTVSKEMRPLILQDTETYCVCFTVPKNTMPEITGFTLNNQIYDCTAPLPDDIRSEHDMTEYLAELPEYQAYAKRFSNELYLRWVEDEIQTADASDRPLPEDCTEVQPEAETLAENYTEEQEISAEHTTHTTVSSRNITKAAQIEELEEPQNEQNSAEDTTISMMIPENTDTESSEIIGDFDLDGRITPADYAWADLILYAELENIIDELPLNEEQMRQCELIPNDTTMSPLGEEEYKAIQNAGTLCWWGITNALDFRAYLDNQEYYNKLLHEYIPRELHPQSDDDNFTVLVKKIQRYTADSCMKRYGNQGWWSTVNFEGYPIASLDEILVELEAAKDWKVGCYI